MSDSRSSVCILTQWYPPEPAPFGHMMRELAVELARKNWEVTVITGFPNHPSGEVHAGYRKRWVHEENVDGVRIVRVWLATSPRRSFFTRFLTFATFTLTASWRLLRQRKVDVVFAVLQPLSLGALFPFIAKIKKAALVFNIQDLHPDTQIKLGMIRNPILIKALHAIEKFAYRACDHLTVICSSFKSHCIECGVRPESISIVENWIDTNRIFPLDRNNEFRRQADCSVDDFIVLWAGTLGYVSGADVIVDAARQLVAAPHIKFVVVGDGPLREKLMQRSKEYRLKNIIFLPFQPEKMLPEVQAAADVSLVTMDSKFAATSVPSKVLAYIAAGRPIVAVVPQECETAHLLRRAGCASIVSNGDIGDLAEKILELANDRERTEIMGLQARRYAEAHLSKFYAAARYDKIFRSLLSVR